MKIINISADNESYDVFYEPIIIKDNYILVSKVLNKENNHLNSGFYKYDISGKSFSRIKTSAPITYYFLSSTKEKLFYVYSETFKKYYILHFYELNYKEETDKEIFQFNLPRYWQPYGDGDFFEIGPEVAIGDCLQVFSLNDRYLMYLHNIEQGIEAEEREDGFYIIYNPYSIPYYEYELYLYDMIEEKTYKSSDISFIGEHLNLFEAANVGNKDYLVLRSCFDDPEDKKYYVWDERFNKEDDFERWTENRDSIKLFSVDTLIDGIKSAEEKLPYKEIDFLGANGSIDFIKVIDTKIYYDLITFDDGKERLASYDILSGQYSYTNIPFSDAVTISINDDIYFISSEGEDTKITSSDGETNIFISKNNSGSFIGLLDKKFAAIDCFRKYDNGYSNVCMLKDIYTNTVVKEIKGRSKVFEDNGVLVVY